MSAINPSGGQAYWWNGLPFGGVQLGTNDAGKMQFWDNGLPNQFLFPTAAGGGVIKTINGLAIASVKTINGVAIASIKTYNGAATQ